MLEGDGRQGAYRNLAYLKLLTAVLRIFYLYLTGSKVFMVESTKQRNRSDGKRVYNLMSIISNIFLSNSYRWNVAARCVLASLGGLAWISAFGALCATLFARVDWMPLTQSVHVMTLFSFVGWCAIAMWVFHHKRLPIVAVRLVGSTVLFYLLFHLLK